MISRRPSAFALRLAACLLTVAVGQASRLPGAMGQTSRLPGTPSTRDISTFPGLARIFRELSVATTTEPEVARLFDFELVLAAVSGQPAFAGHSMQEYREAFAGARAIETAAAQGAGGRDDTAYRLHSLGYSAKEIADIVSGRITRSALDNAQKMLMLGNRPQQVSDFLDREYARLQAARDRAERERLARKSPGESQPTPGLFDAEIVRLAALHGVDAGLVRAVIRCESGWNQDAVSRVGALGLMQLMPGTARELGVDPRDPLQNIEGGVRYLASLLGAFKSTEQALVAYNAGPGFASRFARGQAALYGETREFVKAVMQQMAGSRGRRSTVHSQEAKVSRESRVESR
jgi:soluble lytic murein transglycosylase-like protein